MSLSRRRELIDGLLMLSYTINNKSGGQNGRVDTASTSHISAVSSGC